MPRLVTYSVEEQHVESFRNISNIKITQRTKHGHILRASHTSFEGTAGHHGSEMSFNIQDMMRSNTHSMYSNKFDSPKPSEMIMRNYQDDLRREQMQQMLQRYHQYYRCHDYLKTHYTEDFSTPLKSKRVDENCRFKIVEWCYKVVDFFSLDRDIAFYTMNYLDRFMAQHQDISRPTYKLASTTALMLAIKLHQPRRINLSSVVKDLSKGQFDMSDVERMEIILLKSLKWRTHPASPAAFVLMMMKLEPSITQARIQEVNWEEVLDKAIFFTEASVYHYSFVTEDPSTIALASIVNAMESMNLLREDFDTTRWRRACKSLEIPKTPVAVQFIERLFQTLGIDRDGIEISECRSKLWEAYRCSKEHANNMEALYFEQQREKIDMELAKKLPIRRNIMMSIGRKRKEKGKKSGVQRNHSPRTVGTSIV